jgi:hypothetical protein
LRAELSKINRIRNKVKQNTCPLFKTANSALQNEKIT